MKKKKYILIVFLLALFLGTGGVSAAVACGNVSGIPERIPKITSRIISIAQVAVPVLMILFGVMDFVRGMTGGKSEEIGQRRKIFVKRLIIGALVFFIIAITKLLVSVVADSVSSANVSKCIDCFISNNCSNSNDSSTNTKKVKSGTAGTSKQESELEQKAENNKSSKQTNNKSNNSGTTGGNSSTKSKTMYIGDSRTVQMCAYLNNVDWTKCDFAKNGSAGYEADGIMYIAKGSMGYNWFSTTAVNGAKRIKGNDSYNIVILMGVNDVGKDSGKSAADSYYSKVSSLATGDWKNDNVIFVSVNPVVDGQSGAYMSGVNAFNTEMKSKISSSNISNLKYCDTASSFTDSDTSSGDGLHYSSATYKKIKDKIQSDCLK